MEEKFIQLSTFAIGVVINKRTFIFHKARLGAYFGCFMLQPVAN